MSFTQKVAGELRTIQVNKTCCKKSFLCGLLYGAERIDSEKAYVAAFYSEEDAHLAAELIDTGFFSGAKSEVRSASRGGHRAYFVKFSSRVLTGVPYELDGGKRSSIPEAVAFRCPECECAFLRGAFLSLAAISRPKSGYHLEIKLRSEARARALSELLAEAVAAPSLIRRGDKWGLYYKSNARIADVLYYVGAHASSFDVANLAVERDIINREHRSTNCETGNISRSVAASVRHAEAIRYLSACDKMHLLGEELEYTARMRLEHEDATLLELALMHVPPISKSGLNSRLMRIQAIADEQRQESKK